jgi:hypothetical protein
MYYKAKLLIAPICILFRVFFYVKRALWSLAMTTTKGSGGFYVALVVIHNYLVK